MPFTYTHRQPEFLTSWKEIANFLGKGVRTVQRWEAMLGLPVIRPADRRSGIVMARPRDLEAWALKGRDPAYSGPDAWQQKTTETRATFGECVREMHRYHAEVRALCSQVATTRQTLRQEIERLTCLSLEWNRIREQIADGTNPPISTKIN